MHDTRCCQTCDRRAKERRAEIIAEWLMVGGILACLVVLDLFAQLLRGAP